MSLSILLDGSVYLDATQVAKLEPTTFRGHPQHDSWWLLDLDGKRLGRIERPLSRDRWLINHELPARYHTRQAAVRALLERVEGEKGRQAAAEQAFRLYDWGPEEVVATTIWTERLRDCLHRTVFLRTPQSGTVQRQFKVVFEGPGSSEVKEAYVMTPREEESCL